MQLKQSKVKLAGLETFKILTKRMRFSLKMGRCEESSIDLEEATADADSSPVVRLVSSLIATAVREGASDIHVEPSADCTKMRFRIDGVLT